MLAFLEYNISKCWHRLKTVFCIHVLCCFTGFFCVLLVFNICFYVQVLVPYPMFKTILNHDFHDHLQCRDFSWHIQVYTANIIKYTPGLSWQPIERKKCHISNLSRHKSALFTHDHDHLLHLFFLCSQVFHKTEKKIYIYTIWKKMRSYDLLNVFLQGNIFS